MVETGMAQRRVALDVIDLPDLTPSVAYERNGAWAEQDWSNVPVRPRSDLPPPDIDPDTGAGVDASWLDHVSEPHLGPVEWLRELAPSGQLLCELEGLPADLVESDADAVEMVAHWNRMEAYCAMRKRVAAAALARRAAMADGLVSLSNLGKQSCDPNIASDELAMRLGIGRRAAATLIRSGRAFSGAGIPTGEALALGEIDAAKADAIVAGVEELPAMAALEVQERVLAKAPHIPSGKVRTELAKAVAEIDPEHFEERCQLAMQKRRVDRPRPLPDGMASLHAVMPAVAATQLYRALDAGARSAKTTGDDRTLDHLRADLLALMGETAVQTGWIGRCPAPPEAAAVIDGERPDSDHQQFHVSDLPEWAGGQPTDSARNRSETSGDTVAARERDPGGPPQPREPQRRRRGQPEPEPGRQQADEAWPDRPLPARPDPGSGQPDPRAPEPIPPDRPDLRDAEPGQPNPREREPDRQAQAEPPRAADCRGMRVGVLGGKSAHVRVVVPLSAIMGGEDGPGADLEGASAPAELEGYGPVPASVARALAAGGPWARLVTDPVDRTVLEVSRDVYTPPPRMAELVRAREPECVSPPCSVTSDGCDLHHRVPWPVGATSVANIDPECRRDHNLITHGGWVYAADSRTGARTWRTAAGLTYTEDAKGNLLLLREGKTAAETAAMEAAADERRRRYEGPPPF